MSEKSILDGLQRATQRLIADNRRLRGEVERLREGRVRAVAENKRLEEVVKELDKKLTVKELAGSFGAGGKQRVERLVREIDLCLEMLNKN